MSGLVSRFIGTLYTPMICLECPDLSGPFALILDTRANFSLQKLEGSQLILSTTSTPFKLLNTKGKIKKEQLIIKT